MAASFADRKRFAEKAKIQTKGYWLTQSRYLQQVGDDAPTYVAAAPNAPVQVLLPHGKKVGRTKKDGTGWEHDEYKEDAFLKAIVDEAEPPAKLVDAHLPGKKGEPVKKAHVAHGKEGEAPKA